MKTGKKALLLALCAVLLVAATVLGTMAYLTDTANVENSFSIGSVDISLDETKVNTDGTDVTGAARTDKNDYKLMPGHFYKKDPIVHVAANSEDSYIFVKVENGISAYEATTETTDDGYKTIADQIDAYEWHKLAGVDGVYYKEYASNEKEVNLNVFDRFKIADDANERNGWGAISKDTTKVTITAYAVQKDGFKTAKDAWNATFGKPATPTT